jgi:hypothetical protein
MILIVKPEQSGKTFVMLKEICDIMAVKNKSDNETLVNFIISQNNLLQVNQTGVRMNNDTGLMYYTDIDKPFPQPVYTEFSSKSNTCNKESISTYIQHQGSEVGMANVLCCGNGTRFKDIRSIITGTSMMYGLRKLEEKYNYKKHHINIWCDEADTMVNLLEKTIMPIIDEYKVNLYLLTATPEKLIKKYEKKLSIHNMNNTTLDTYYYGWSDIRSNFGVKSISDPVLKSKYCSNVGFVKYVLKQNKEERKPGTRWFIPTGYTKKNHAEMADTLYGKGFNVMVINGDGITIHHQTTGKHPPISKDKPTEQLLPELYSSKGLHSHPFALTGNLCIDRGITIINLEQNFQFDYAIMPYDLTDDDKISQTAGRIKGNYKGYENFKEPVVYCTTLFDKKASQREYQSRMLGKLYEKITHKEFKNIRDTSSNMSYSELADGTPFSESNIRWISNTFDPNDKKPTRCNATFTRNSEDVWVHYDNKPRIFGDDPPGGRGRNGEQQWKWVLIYKDCSYTQYTFIKCKFN